MSNLRNVVIFLILFWSTMFITLFLLTAWLKREPLKTREIINRKLIYYYYGRVWFGMSPAEQPDLNRRKKMKSTLKMVTAVRAITGIPIATALFITGWYLFSTTRETEGAILMLIISPIFVLLFLFDSIIFFLTRHLAKQYYDGIQSR